MYKHIDFLSDNKDFEWSSSSWEAFTYLDETNSTSNITTDKKRELPKYKTKDKKRKETMLHDNKENTKLENRERKINKRKASGKEYITKTK